MAKVYAVKKGIDPLTGKEIENQLFTDWPTAQSHVKGVKGAEYKSFATRSLAEEYLGTANPLIHKKDNTYSKTALHLYVDGSVNMDIPNYSYGIVCVQDGKLLHMEGKQGTNPQAIEMRQIGGELLGAIKALLYAKEHGHTEAVIFHDYEGTCYHATGFWKRSNAFSETYYQWMQAFFADHPHIKVVFCKVDAHTGDDFNELADGQAKLALGIEPDPVYRRMVEKYRL